MVLIVYAVCGLGGGIVRGLAGYFKYVSSYKQVKFDLKYFLITISLSGLIGAIAGYLISGILVDGTMNNYYAMLAGYAGGDFFENAYKIVFKKPMLFKMPEILETSLNQSLKSTAIKK